MGYIYKKKIIHCIFILLILWGYGCSGGDDSSFISGDSGAITFGIKWPETEAAKSIAGNRCLDGTIQTITFGIYDRNGSLLVNMDDATFDCSDGGGVIEQVPTGSGIRLVVLAKGIVQYGGNELIYLRGEYSDDITVEADKTTSLGLIDTYTFTSSLLHPVSGLGVSRANLNFEWTAVTGASTYKIHVARLYPAETKDYFSDQSSFSPPSSDDVFYTFNTSYQWYVTPIDTYENYGPDSETDQFMLLE
ncbi:MAG: hypothetical protein KKD44_00170 [Proteobacteria bacterium]|nr:hypothetical protein [Pseudomonadota bacterium]